jgi:hypothetical protein
MIKITENKKYKNKQKIIIIYKIYKNIKLFIH